MQEVDWVVFSGIIFIRDYRDAGLSRTRNCTVMLVHLKPQPIPQGTRAGIDLQFSPKCRGLLAFVPPQRPVPESG